MSWLAQDLRSAWRQLARHRSLTLISLVTLGLGIGATTTSFSILQVTTFQSLPFPDAENLVVLEGVDRATGRSTQLSFPDFVDLTDGSQVGDVFDAAAYRIRTVVLESAAGEEGPITTAEVSPGFFDVLGVRPTLGRVLSSTARDPSSDLAVVLSHGFHTRHFDGERDALGGTLSLAQQNYHVLGVAPESSAFPSDVDVWIELNPESTARRDERSFHVIARRSSSLEETQVALDRISARLAVDHPDSNRGWAAIATPLGEALGKKHRDAATALLFVSALTLCLACLNLANLLLAHASARRHELALRCALGATRTRIVHLLITEGCLLALGGAALGLLLAQWGLASFETFLGAPAGASWMRFELEPRSVAFAAWVALAAGMTFGAACSLQLSETDLRQGLREKGTGAGSGLRGRRFRRALVVGQLALSLTMVVGAGSVVASSLRLTQIDTGFDRERLVSLKVDGGKDQALNIGDVDSIRDALADLPGVESITVASHAPLIDRRLTYLSVKPESSEGQDLVIPASTRFVDADFHRALGIPILRGRPFQNYEARDPSSRQALVNPMLAAVLWPDQDPIGQRLQVGDSDGGSASQPWFTVIGIAGSVSERQLAEPSGYQLTLPMAHAEDLSFVVRAESSPDLWIEAARNLLSDSGHTVLSVGTMDESMRWYERDRRLQGGVLGALGLVALLLGTLGVYGSMALRVNEQTREIGVRMALGSSRHAIVRRVLGQALGLAMRGMAWGLPLAAAFGIVLSSLFSEVKVLDPWPTLGVLALLSGAALVAAYRPARRAAEVDPIVALRAD